jgi:hypothetical protein
MLSDSATLLQHNTTKRLPNPAVVFVGILVYLECTVQQNSRGRIPSNKTCVNVGSGVRVPCHLKWGSCITPG